MLGFDRKKKEQTKKIQEDKFTKREFVTTEDIYETAKEIFVDKLGDRDLARKLNISVEKMCYPDVEKVHIPENIPLEELLVMLEQAQTMNKVMAKAVSNAMHRLGKKDYDEEKFMMASYAMDPATKREAYAMDLFENACTDVQKETIEIELDYKDDPIEDVRWYVAYYVECARTQISTFKLYACSLGMRCCVNDYLRLQKNELEYLENECKRSEENIKSMRSAMGLK